MTTHIGGSKLLLLIVFCVLSTEFQWKVVVVFWFNFSGGKPTRHKKKRTKSTERELFVLCHKKVGKQRALGKQPSLYVLSQGYCNSSKKDMLAKSDLFFSEVDELSLKPIPMDQRNRAPLKQYSCARLMYYFKRIFVNVAVSMLV